MMSADKNARVDLDRPRWDQSTFSGRFKHFWFVTNPLNILKTDQELEKAKNVVFRYRQGENFPNHSIDWLWKQKYIYDSAFHPETGEKMLVIGRMAGQVPINMLITGMMITFYKSLGAVVFWQWFNQSYNAIVNYSNRSGTEKVSTESIFKSYATATTAACTTAVGLNLAAVKFPPIFARLVPFTAIVAANSINLPISRYREIEHGMKIMDANDNELGYSSKVAKIGIAQVVLSRVTMAIPTMVFLPFVMNKLDKAGFLKKYPRFALPFQVIGCGALLTFSTPFGCALFPQKASLPVSWLEPKLQEEIRQLPNAPKVVYYNKGL